MTEGSISPSRSKAEDSLVIKTLLCIYSDWPKVLQQTWPKSLKLHKLFEMLDLFNQYAVTAE